jgi:hypothetical protein
MAADPGRDQPARSLREQQFRDRFHLRGRDRGLAQLYGPAKLEPTVEQQDYVVGVILNWIAIEMR